MFEWRRWKLFCSLFLSLLFPCVRVRWRCYHDGTDAHVNYDKKNVKHIKCQMLNVKCDLRLRSSPIFQYGIWHSSSPEPQASLLEMPMLQEEAVAAAAAARRLLGSNLPWSSSHFFPSHWKVASQLPRRS